jgi:hypothetical protein
LKNQDRGVNFENGCRDNPVKNNPGCHNDKAQDKKPFPFKQGIKEKVSNISQANGFCHSRLSRRVFLIDPDNSKHNTAAQKILERNGTKNNPRSGIPIL